MGFRPCLGLHCQADPSRVEHVPRGAPQREIYSGRETVVNCTCLNAHLRFLVMSRPRLTLSLARTFQRILFLESIAGVPGMVAATLRHLKSLRLMVCIVSTYLLVFNPLKCSFCNSYVGKISSASGFRVDSHPVRGSRERTHAPDVRGLNFRSFRSSFSSSVP